MSKVKGYNIKDLELRLNYTGPIKDDFLSLKKECFYIKGKMEIHEALFGRDEAYEALDKQFNLDLAKLERISGFGSTDPASLMEGLPKSKLDPSAIIICWVNKQNKRING